MQTLSHRQEDSALAGIRDGAAPAKGQKAFPLLWADEGRC